MASLKSRLRRHRRIALDTSVWIYHLEHHRRYHALSSTILTEVTEGRCRGIVSELTLLELLVRPLQLERQDLADEYEALLVHFPNLDLIPLNREILLRAAMLRARYALRTPDALILATAFTCGASIAVTNDNAWKRVQEIEVLCLDDYIS